jgi:hypothetical protein
MASHLMKITVEHVDGTTVDLTVKPVTIVAFERQFGVGLGALQQDGRMEYVYWLAWDSEKRAGRVVKPFDGWLEDVADIDVDDEPAPLLETEATREQ